jgi:hypothetical protein
MARTQKPLVGRVTAAAARPGPLVRSGRSHPGVRDCVEIAGAENIAEPGRHDDVVGIAEDQEVTARLGGAGWWAKLEPGRMEASTSGARRRSAHRPGDRRGVASSEPLSAITISHDLEYVCRSSAARLLATCPPRRTGMMTDTKSGSGCRCCPVAILSQ